MNQIIDDLGTYREALGQAQMSGIESLEVSDRLFKFLVQTDPNTAYLTVGKPGVKIYRAGTKEQIKKNESLSADQNLERLTKEKAAKYRV